MTGANLLFGSVNIPAEAVWHILTGNEVEKASWSFIVWESRLPQAITALLCGMALAASGLMLQTTFNNPLGRFFHTWASVQEQVWELPLVMLAGAGTITAGVFTLSGFISVIIGAFIGSMLVMGIILFFSTLIKNSIMLLIIGIMIGYITSSAISLLNFFSTAEGVHSYMIWGMGNFGGVSLQQLPFFSLVTATGLLITILLDKASECPAAGNTLCRKPGNQHSPYTQPAACRHRITDSDDNRFLRPDFLSSDWLCRTLPASCWEPPTIIPLLPVTMLTGGAIALALQLHLHSAGRSRYHSAKRRHPGHWCAHYYLCHCEPT